MIPALMLQQMILPRKAILSLPCTIPHIAIDELDVVSRHEVAADIGSAGERRAAARMGARFSTLISFGAWLLKSDSLSGPGARAHG